MNMKNFWTNHCLGSFLGKHNTSDPIKKRAQ